MSDYPDCPDCGLPHDVEACTVIAADCDCCKSIEAEKNADAE